MRQRPSWFFWTLASVAATQMAWLVILLINFIRDPFVGDPQFGSVAYAWLTVFVLLPLALTVSILVLRRAPGNVVGLCLLMWVVTIIGSGTIRADSDLYVYDQMINISWWGLWLLAIYFPDGRSAFPRFETPLRLFSLCFLVFIPLALPSSPVWSATNNYGHHLVVANPLYVPALAPLNPIVVAISNVVLPIVVGGVILLVIPSLVVRYRRSDERVRQQIRWLAWAFAIALALFLLLTIPGWLLKGADTSNIGPVGQGILVVFGIYVALFPYIAVGNAILRHRLYDIDVIIRRTLIYGVLSALLLLVYFGSVILLQQIFRALTGQGQDLAIILSTLVLAALFNPLRVRVQRTIDQRFYRRKYDARRVLEGFAATVRDEVDLARLTDELMGVVDTAMQPEHMSVWVRKT